MSNSSEWDDIQRTLQVGSLVSCDVTRHAPFGVFARISGVPFDGLIEITGFKATGKMTAEEYPAVGSTLTAVVLGFKQTGQQLWLGVKPSQPARADQQAARYSKRKAVSVGLRVGPDCGFELIGLTEANALLSRGAKVVAIEPGDAIMLKVGETEDNVRLRLNGFSVRVQFEGGDNELGDSS
jgi:hypothetical protein